MVGDEAALEVLRGAVADWESRGPLAVLRKITGRVWRTDIARHEPKLGDDSICLGMTASRNICNLAIRELQGSPGVETQDLRTLEIRFAGRVLHVGKAPSSRHDWDIRRVDWSTSEIRDHAAKANSALYQPLTGTLFEGSEPVSGQSIDAGRLTHLHYVWVGADDGTTSEWIGFPRVEEPYWFAAMQLGVGHGFSERGPILDIREPQAPTVPAFDQLAEPAVPVTRRRAPAASGSQEERGA